MIKKMLNFFLHRLPCHLCAAPLLGSNRAGVQHAGELRGELFYFFCPCYKKSRAAVHRGVFVTLFNFCPSLYYINKP